MAIDEQEVRKLVLERLKREKEVLPVLAREFPEEYEGYTPIAALKVPLKHI